MKTFKLSCKWNLMTGKQFMLRIQWNGLWRLLIYQAKNIKIFKLKNIKLINLEKQLSRMMIMMTLM